MDSSNKAESVFHEQISRSEEKEQMAGQGQLGAADAVRPDAARVYAVSLIKMVGELEEMDAPVQVHAPRIRLLSLPYAEDAVAAGVGADGFEANCRQCYVHDTPQLREADILFHVNGDSMEPTYPDSCTVMVRKSSEVDTGDIGIFSVDGTLFIKECQPDGLHSINPKYPPMLSKKFGKIRIIGRVMGMMEDGDFACEAEIRDFQAQK